jgi:cation diffusion facilitator CzcD-associated flavoprotein CzcO
MDQLAGLVSPRPARPPSLDKVTTRRDISAVIIGAGFGGLAAAVELRRRGIQNVTVLEKADRVGGVWRDNTYPGAACDVPSSLYSYSFAPNPDWDRRYAEQPDILGYIEDVAAREGLAELVRTGTEVTDAVWDEATARWQVRTRSTDGTDGPDDTATTYDADLLVSAVGQLSRPHIPRLAGMEVFSGPAFHSAQWDHEVDLTGKRVVVVGTGASAIQFVPHLQRRAAHVTVVQRSAPYVVPKPDRAYRRLHHRAFRRAPVTQTFGRELTRSLSEQLNRALAEQTVFTKAFLAAFKLHLRHQVKDPSLRARLVPDYPVGCKRLLFSNDWYPALTQPNVDVVTGGVAEVTADSVRTTDGTEHPADVIVYGTGFLATEFLAPMRIVGRDGRDLHEEWAAGAHAYLGMTVPGFPNFAMVYGPNTNLGGSSILSMIECQTGYIGQAAEALAGGLDRVEVRTDVAERYDHEMQERLSQSVWTSGCASWYQTPGGRVTTNWPGQVREYRERTAAFELADYEHPGVRPAGIGHPAERVGTQAT